MRLRVALPGTNPRLMQTSISSFTLPERSSDTIYARLTPISQWTEFSTPWASGLGRQEPLSNEGIDIQALQQTWAAFDRVAHLRPIRNGQEYGRTVALMNYLLDVVGDNENHALADLLDLAGELVEDYDSSHFTIEASEPKEVLRYLIASRGLKQGDLAEIVPQGNLSAILSGKRKISATLAGKLAKFFNVSSSIFVPG